MAQPAPQPIIFCKSHYREADAEDGGDFYISFIQVNAGRPLRKWSLKNISYEDYGLYYFCLHKI